MDARWSTLLGFLDVKIELSPHNPAYTEILRYVQYLLTGDPPSDRKKFGEGP